MSIFCSIFTLFEFLAASELFISSKALLVYNFDKRIFRPSLDGLSVWFWDKWNGMLCHSHHIELTNLLVYDRFHIFRFRWLEVPSQFLDQSTNSSVWDISRTNLGSISYTAAFLHWTFSSHNRWGKILGMFHLNMER